MKITIYELLGMVKDKTDINIYIRYYDKLDNKTDVMLACKENIIYKLDRTSIELNDEVEILEEEKELPEKLGICAYVDGEIAYSWSQGEAVLKTKINEIIDYLKSKGE